MLAYRHAFHAGNHADVLKHVVLLALCEALTAKPSPCFALDTHAGRGLYKLDGEAAQATGEAQDGIARLQAEAPRDPAIQRYLAAVRACRGNAGVIPIMLLFIALGLSSMGPGNIATAALLIPIAMATACNQ